MIYATTWVNSFTILFCRPLLVSLSFDFSPCIVLSCPSLANGFWLSLWYLQTFLVKICYNIKYCLLNCHQKMTGDINASYCQTIGARLTRVDVSVYVRAWFFFLKLNKKRYRKCTILYFRIFHFLSWNFHWLNVK